MGFVLCNEIGDGRTREQTDTLEVRLTRVFQVVTDDPTMSGEDVAAHVSLPVLFEAHPDNADALAISITPEQGENHYEWKVTVEYSTHAEPLDADPLTRDPEIRWSTQPYTQPAIEDIDGEAILNSAFDAFDPPATVDGARLVLTYTRNEETFNPAEMLGYVNTVNDDDFVGFSAGCAKIKSIDAVSAEEPGFPAYWVVTYVIEFKNNWLLTLLDQGYRKYDDSGNVWSQISDGSGRAVTQPALLDGAGQPLDISTDDPVFLEFEIYEAVDFSPLDITI